MKSPQRAGDPEWIRAKFRHDKPILKRGGFWTMILVVLFCGGMGALGGAALYFEFIALSDPAIFVFMILGFASGAGMGFAFWRESRKNDK